MSNMAWFRRMAAIFGNVVLDNSITADKLQADSVTTAKLVDEAVTAAKIEPEAITATQLADDAVETNKIADGAVTAAKLDAELLTIQVPDGSVTNVKVKAGAGITPDKLAVPNAQLIIGDTSGAGAPKAISGDIEISNAGVASIVAGSVIGTDINTGANIAYSKLATLASGNLLIGSAGGVATSLAMKGDATIIADGTITIGAGVVATSKIADAAAIKVTQLETLGDTEIIVGVPVDGGTPAHNAKVALSGDVTMDKTGATAIAAGAVTTTEVADDAGIAVTQLEGLASGEIVVGVDGTGAGNDKVTVTGDVTMANTGVTTLNAAHAEQVVIIPVEDLGVGIGIADRPVFVHTRANTIQSIGLLVNAASVGIGAAPNDVVITMEVEGAVGAPIVTKTFVANLSPGYVDLGTLTEHADLAAEEYVTLTVEQGTTADLPAFSLVIVTVPDNA